MLVLLDRDGVLNQDSDAFIKTPDEFVMLEGAAEAVARLNAAGHTVAIVTNQSGIGRGLLTEDMLQNIHNKLKSALQEKGGHVDAIFYCSDPPWNATPRRKPGPGMLQEAMAQFRAGPEDCVMIGDSLRDLQAAATLNIKRILVRTGKGQKTQAKGLSPEVLPVAVCDNLAAAVDMLLEGTR